MQSRSGDRYAELLGILKEIDTLSPETLRQSDLPEQAKRLLNEINASKTEPVTTVRTKRFQLIPKDDSVKWLLAKLESASRQGKIPTPYPIDEDPLRLEAWTREQNPEDVVAIADTFPPLRSALFSYVNATGVNHLTGMVHHGELIDIELELFSRKQWKIIPAGDAVQSGPAANFIVLMKVTLLHYASPKGISEIRKSLKQFIELRSTEDIARLIHCCKRFEWPPEVHIAIPDKIAYANATRNHPIEDLMVDLIAPLLAMDASKMDLLNLLKTVNPARVNRALQPLASSHRSSEPAEG
jgi:hypothetical protein